MCRGTQESEILSIKDPLVSLLLNSSHESSMHRDTYSNLIWRVQETFLVSPNNAILNLEFENFWWVPTENDPVVHDSYDYMYMYASCKELCLWMHIKYVFHIYTHW